MKTLKVRRYATELDYLRALEKAVFQVVPRECGEECCENPPLDEALGDLTEAFLAVWGPECDHIPLEPPVASARSELAEYVCDAARVAEDAKKAIVDEALADALSACERQVIPLCQEDEYRRGQRRGALDCVEMVRRLRAKR